MAADVAPIPLTNQVLSDHNKNHPDLRRGLNIDLSRVMSEASKQQDQPLNISPAKRKCDSLGSGDTGAASSALIGESPSKTPADIDIEEQARGVQTESN